MNYGGDAADQIVRYSMEGMEPEKDLWKDTDGTYDQRTKADQIFYRAG